MAEKLTQRFDKVLPHVQIHDVLQNYLSLLVKPVTVQVSTQVLKTQFMLIHHHHHLLKPSHHFRRNPLVICGPSGVGKGTITDLLLKEFPNQFEKCVSHTTRQPRNGEISGRDYHFVKDSNLMRKWIENGDFLEHAVVHGNLYGTSYESISKIEEKGRICVLDIDVFGLKQIIAATKVQSVNRVGIIPKSSEDLENRLKGRGSETEATLKKRLFASQEEIRCILNDGIVDAIIENIDSWKHGYPTLKLLLKKWYPSVFSSINT